MLIAKCNNENVEFVMKKGWACIRHTSFNNRIECMSILNVIKKYFGVCVDHKYVHLCQKSDIDTACTFFEYLCAFCPIKSRIGFFTTFYFDT